MLSRRKRSESGIEYLQFALVEIAVTTKEARKVKNLGRRDLTSRLSQNSKQNKIFNLYRLYIFQPL